MAHYTTRDPELHVLRCHLAFCGMNMANWTFSSSATLKRSRDAPNSSPSYCGKNQTGVQYRCLSFLQKLCLFLILHEATLLLAYRWILSLERFRSKGQLSIVLVAPGQYEITNIKSSQISRNSRNRLVLFQKVLITTFYVMNLRSLFLHVCDWFLFAKNAFHFLFHRWAGINEREESLPPCRIGISKNHLCTADQFPACMPPI